LGEFSRHEVHGKHGQTHANSDIILAARSLLGTPFKHQGRSDKIDCVGLLIAVAKTCNRKWVDRRGYSRHPDGITLVDALNEGAVRIPEPEFGCIVAIENHKDMPYHVGILADHPAGGFSIIHTDAHVGKVSEHYFHPEFFNIVGYWNWLQ
jgi:cell wall-associated NlpC family hydrolase